MAERGGQGNRGQRMSNLAIFAGAVGLLLAASIVWTTLRVGISPMPSSAKATRAIVELIPGNAGDRFAELGSGWGTLALAVTSHRPKAHVVAYELSLLPWVWSILMARLRGREKIEFVRRDFFDADLSATDVVLCYLFPGGMERLAKMLTHLKPGAIVISNTFRLPGWQPDEVVTLDDLYRTRVYRYVVGQAVRQRAS